MNEYTPQTPNIRQAYLSWMNGDGPDFDANAAFERWLTEIKAQAYDEGVASLRITHSWTENPYRLKGENK